MTKKIYIAGSGGMLGDAFYKVFSKDYNIKCTDIDVNENWLSSLDFWQALENDSKSTRPDPSMSIYFISS